MGKFAEPRRGEAAVGAGKERERIALLSTIFGAGNVPVGVGDDAAVLEGGLVWTIDAQIEGTHFERAWLSWSDIGWRSFMAAASDLAAMNASPSAALSALVLDPTVDDAALEALARGQAEAARAIGAPVVGGNLARGRETAITTTLLGRASRPVLRSGARIGDGVWLAGFVGRAATGLTALRDGVAADPRVIEAWRRPRALVGHRLHDASAAIDVSDGLARDATHIADASGVRILLDEASLQATDPAIAIDAMLHGGEDYALLATSPVGLPGFVRIGVVEEGRGVALRTASGVTPIPPRGWDHFDD
jgi:thiamine-monophosphate kinase